MSYKIGIYCAPYEPGWYYLEGISGRNPSRTYWEAFGWEWVRGVGRPGLYRTTDTETVRKTTQMLGVGLQEYREDRA